VKKSARCTVHLAARLADEDDVRVEREHDRRHVADGRCVDDVARERRAAADLPRRERPEHLVDHRVLATERLFERGERRRAADAPAMLVLLDRGELRHSLGRDEERVALVELVDPDADLRRARDELRRLVLRLDVEQLGERRRTQEPLSVRLVVDRLRRDVALLQSKLEEIVRTAARLLLRERIEHRFADRSIAGASTEVAVQLVDDLRPIHDVLAVVRLEHRDDEAGRAVSALRPVAIAHRRLHRVQLLGRERHAFDSDDLSPRDHRQERDARVDRSERLLAVGVRLDERDGARTAVTFRASFFRSGASRRAQPGEERRVRRDSLHGHVATVEDERK
jgi:hypothetical protein